jgi:ADP-ribosyl-[dinitrogen reductase] hydrolase
MLAGALYGPDALPLRWLKALDREVLVACETQAARLVGAAPGDQSPKFVPTRRALSIHG